LIVVDSGYPSLDFLGDVSVLLGNGDGTFQSMVNYKAGRYPQSVVVADFNGDGILDLSIINWGEGDLSVLLGNANGTFKDAVNFSAAHGAGPYAMAGADFNGDGKPDLAIAGGLFSTNVSVLLNNGDATFQTAVQYDGGLSPFFVTVGDFNGDGKPDLAVANGGSYQKNYTDGNVSVLLGNGDGTFRTAVSYDAGSSPQSVAVGDFNADGKSDLVVINKNSDDISVLLGRGDGTFQAAVNYSVGREPQSVAIGDFDGDGRLDLAVGNSAAAGPFGSITVLLGTGDGRFQAAPRYGAGTGPVATAVGDFNGDGKPDLAVTHQGIYDQSSRSRTNSGVSILLGNGDGTFKAAFNSAAGTWPYSLTASDFNQDGKLDLVVIDFGSPYGSDNGFLVLLGNGDGTFQAAVKYSLGVQTQSVAAGDFNGDGLPDLAVGGILWVTGTFMGYPTGSRYGNVSVLLGRGDGTFVTATDYRLQEGAFPVLVLVGDLNGDGKPDLITGKSV